MNDVVITGLGATTPLGGDVESSWQALLAGKSGVRRLDDWPEDIPTQIAALYAEDPASHLEKARARRLDRSQQAAIVGAREAWENAGSPDVDPDRLAVVIGTGIGGAVTLLAQHDLRLERGARRVSPHMVPMLMPNGPAAAVGLEVGARGGVHTTVSACASGAEALALGLDLIRAGRVDVVVAGGAEACIHPTPFAGFGMARAMSTNNDDPEAASRPFDAARNGFVMGEGTAVMVLESAEHAAARGATPIVRLAGAGITSDSYDMVAPEPSGSGAARAIRLALRNGGVDAADVHHVNAHATSTPVGDIAEAAAIRAAIGDHALISATKASTGHMMGASGAVEALFTILALRDQVAPHILNLTDPDADPNVQALDLVRDEPRKAEMKAAINNSFGFGGHNAALLFTTA
ncbi:beta-ketoacyl-[acyl-carrier-protein] synthase family protein [Epidermidibacterium keratini]|uniref:beta-ketoacyl-[acyl-carrier-protein] synthase family protein n=1 Tax=Epidermidibacterium keratini TaxID=1891644 RepID=UPI001CEF5FBE|nr:beta-ketoacyl-[acyl-carrier-protein] synthase family protein [Epidermidibacterium keratini]